ncbi:MAG: serine/threonine-protein kinase [Polyangiaceae bacterium]
MAKPGPGQFLTFLKAHSAGDVVSSDEILAAVPAWKKSTLETYRKKNKLVKFMTPMAGGRFRITLDGSQVTEADINAALSQVSPRNFTLARNDKLVGTHDEYVLIRELGSGAVGAVWEAREGRSGNRVAVKVCSPRPDLLEPSVFNNVRDRFRRESRLGPRITHDAIVEYRDYGDYVTTSFLVMELANGSLRDVLNARGVLSLEEVVDVALRAVAGLRHLHAENCVHRDIKPPNILLTDRGYVLGDLGIALWGDLNRSFTGAGTITKATVQLGSFHYMAPEQIEDAHEVGPESDVYALGVTCIELLTGEVPSPHRLAAGRLGSVCSDPAIDTLLADMTAYALDRRPSLPELERVLRSISTHYGTSATG